MTIVDKRAVPLGQAQDATLLQLTFENREARVLLRCANGMKTKMKFFGVEMVTSQAAEGMVVHRLTEEVRLGGRLPSRFVFESADASCSLAITARASISPPATRQSE